MFSGEKYLKCIHSNHFESLFDIFLGSLFYTVFLKEGKVFTVGLMFTHSRNSYYSVVIGAQ